MSAAPALRVRAAQPDSGSLRSFNYHGRDFLVGRPVRQVRLSKPSAGKPFVTLHQDLTALFRGDVGQFQDGQLIDVKLLELVRAGAGLPRITCELYVPPKRPCWR